MKRSGAALIALALSVGSSSLSAESLRDIYELALENDAQLKAEQAQYLANLETVSAIRTQDFAVAVGDREFRLLGRDDAAVARGCSRGVEDVLKQKD